jgi:hypothetical protein
MILRARIGQGKEKSIDFPGMIPQAIQPMTIALIPWIICDRYENTDGMVDFPECEAAFA